MFKNIGIITHNFPISSHDRQNAGIFVYDIAEELSKKNKVHIFAPNEGGRKKRVGHLSVQNFQWFSGKKLGDFKLFSPIDALRFASFFVGGISRISAFIKENKIDVNIVMWAFPAGVFAYLAKKVFKTPYVIWCLGSDIYVYGQKPILKTVIRHILKNADYVFADGIDLADKTKEIGKKNCIFVPSASKAAFRKSVRKANSKLIELTFVGRLEEVKGPDILIKSLLSIGKKIDKFKVNIIGSGSLFEKLKDQVLEAGISNKITFYGNVSDFQKISGILANSDWLIIPSRSDSIPLVFSEAMKCQTPVVASSLPDLAYLIKNYNVGYLFKPGNFRQLADIIVKLPREKEKRKMFSKNTIFASKDFSVEKSAGIILSYLNKHD